MQMAQQRCNYHFINSVQSSLTTLDIKSNKSLTIALEDIKKYGAKMNCFLVLPNTNYYTFQLSIVLDYF